MRSWRWAALLLALIAALAATSGFTAASAFAAVVTETRVGASSVVVEVPVGSPERISAGQWLGEAAAGPGIAVATGVAANSVRSAAPSTFARAETLTGRGSSRVVDDYAESMRSTGWEGIAPIDVVELQGSRIVVDGHHRLAAAKRVGIDVQYRVVDPASVIGPGRYSSIDDILRATYSVGRDKLR